MDFDAGWWGAIGAIVISVATLVREWWKDRIARPGTRAEHEAKRLQNEMTLRDQVNLLWAEKQELLEALDAAREEIRLLKERVAELERLQASHGWALDD